MSNMFGLYIIVMVQKNSFRTHVIKECYGTKKILEDHENFGAN